MEMEKLINLCNKPFNEQEKEIKRIADAVERYVDEKIESDKVLNGVMAEIDDAVVRYVDEKIESDKVLNGVMAKIDEIDKRTAALEQAGGS
jgi:hypothetical protein